MLNFSLDKDSVRREKIEKQICNLLERDNFAGEAKASKMNVQ